MEAPQEKHIEREALIGALGIEKAGHISEAPNEVYLIGAESNQLRKRSYLDIVTNPTQKRDNEPKKILKESPISITSLLRASGQSDPPLSSPSEPMFPLSSTLIGDGNFNNITNSPMLQQEQSSPPLPPLNTPPNQPKQPSSMLPDLQQSLPSFSALFGRSNLLNTPSQQGRYMQQPAPNQLDTKGGSHAPYMLPGLADGYNPLRISPFSTTFNQSQDTSQQQRGSSDATSGVTHSALRFPLSDRVNALTTGGDQNRFVLLEQPNEIQRKSYKNESRYLLPNPLTVCLRAPLANDKDMPQIVDGTVSVRIINADGNELPSTMQNILESLGGLSRPLDEERSASFSLKVSATSIGSMYRLLFTVAYRVKGSGSFNETILSTPFSVCSNRKKQLKELKERLNQMQKKV